MDTQVIATLKFSHDDKEYLEFVVDVHSYDPGCESTFTTPEECEEIDYSIRLIRSFDEDKNGDVYVYDVQRSAEGKSLDLPSTVYPSNFATKVLALYKEKLKDDQDEYFSYLYDLRRDEG